MYVLNHPDSPGGNDNKESETDDSLSSRIDLRNENQNEEISFETIHNVFNTNESTRARYDENKSLITKFHAKPFEELKVLVNEKKQQSNQHIEQLLNVRHLPKDKLPSKLLNGNSTSNENLKLQMNKINYPELFTY
ncbi:unnamed protein product [Rotaria sp. Silwood2]|nr:unnamed protein product [Rotaria sp. Silwood2]CAF2987520.1 unnamed protein product [Rotaria sp. Silwood2]CAF3131383.1 unnamed protein product [Rotaria sp. Silwood2]CAF3920114.1 unnamed protein product [Rotaria sp. Silwood2]CAF4035179.1 unnamed protein product [Rotaria sp. Silwood2]